MTVQEIKEIRATVQPTEQEYFDAHSVEIVDTLLAEVERLEQVASEKTAIRARLADSLAIATEALERIENSSTHPGDRRQISRTALERIKG